MKQNEQLQNQLRRMRTLVQEMGWHDFMMNVGTLLAEQTYKTPEPRATTLYSCANTIHSLQGFWLDCGRFQYPADMVDTDP